MRIFEHYIKLANPNLDSDCLEELRCERMYYEEMFARLNKVANIVEKGTQELEKRISYQDKELRNFKRLIFECVKYDHDSNSIESIDAKKLMKALQSEAQFWFED